MNIMKRFMILFIASLLISTSIPSMASASSLTSLISSANKYLGTPYRYGGTTTSGFDCSAYVQRVFSDNGISIPRDTVSQYSIGKAVSKTDLQTGDLVFFNTNGKRVSHVGIYIGANNFIHASTSQGVMISSIYDPYYWGSKYVGARRVKDFSPVAVEVAVQTANTLPTRSDIAEILTKELNLEGNNSTSFKDVASNHPQVAAIAAVTTAGIFSGNNGSFNPDGNLTRAQLAKVLVEAFNLEGTSDKTFTDVAESNWASGYIKTLYALNITQGYSDGRFGVDDKVTANEFQTFMERINNQ